MTAGSFGAGVFWLVSMRYKQAMPGDSSPGDTRVLRTVYALSTSALSHTHYVDLTVLSQLADAVLETYAIASYPRHPVDRERIEDLALSSIGRLMDTNPNLLAIKR